MWQVSEGRAKQDPRYQAHPKQGAGQGSSYHHYAANPAPGFKSGHIEVGTCPILMACLVCENIPLI